MIPNCIQKCRNMHSQPWSNFKEVSAGKAVMREGEGAKGEPQSFKPPVPGRGGWPERRGHWPLLCLPHGPGGFVLTTPDVQLFHRQEWPTFSFLPCPVLLSSLTPWPPGTLPSSEPFLDISTQGHAVPACSPIFLVCLDSSPLTKSTPWVCLSRHHLQSRAKGWPTESLNKHMLVDLSILKDTAIISSRAFFVGLLQGEKQI